MSLVSAQKTIPLIIDGSTQLECHVSCQWHVSLDRFDWFPPYHLVWLNRHKPHLSSRSRTDSSCVCICNGCWTAVTSVYLYTHKKLLIVCAEAKVSLYD